MRKINGQRATLLYNEFKSTGFEMNISSMICKLFALEPSFTEKIVCDKCNHSRSAMFPMVVLSDELLSNDFQNLEKAVIENFPENVSCTRCKGDIQCKREFGHHLFIEVIIIIY